MVEPTVLLCHCADADLRVPIWPDRGSYEVPGASVERTADGWVVCVDAPGRPSQVEVDPDHALLDAKPDNNRWKPEVAWRVTPMMTPMDESSQFQAYDRPSIVAGPFIDMYARGGLKLAVQRLDHWQVTAWAGTEPALREAIFGGQFTIFHFPWPKTSAGFFYEEGLYNFYNDRRHSGGRAFLRYRFLESSSFLVDDQGFAELYYGIGNEFWAGDDGRPVNAYLGAVGGRYRLSTLFPYWDPVKGFEVEASAEYGSTLIGSAFNYTRMTGEYGFVRPLPEGLGYLSRTRLALRAYGGFGSPDNQPLFRLGGGRRLRAPRPGPGPGQFRLAGHDRVADADLARAGPRLPRPRRRLPQPLRRPLLRRRPVVPARPLQPDRPRRRRRHPAGRGPLRLPGAGEPPHRPRPARRQARLGPVIWFGLNQVF